MRKQEHRKQRNVFMIEYQKNAEMLKRDAGDHSSLRDDN